MQSFSALADPTRRRILEILADGPRPAGELASSFEMSGQAVSQHLKVLRNAQLVRVRVEAQRRIYELDRAGLIELQGWLDGVTRFWSGRLDALEEQLRVADMPKEG